MSSRLTRSRRDALAQTLESPRAQLSIRDEGFRVISGDALPVVQRHLGDLRALARSRRTTQIDGKEAYLERVEIDLTLDSPVMQLALDPSLISTVTAYLGRLPILTAAWMWFSPNRSWSPVATASQHFHLDHEDDRQVKVLMYLSDVDDEAGPIQVIDRPTSLRICKSEAYRVDQSLPDDVIRRHLSPEKKWTTITGPAGTILLVDTSACLHCGSRPGTRPRWTLGLQYLRPDALRLKVGDDVKRLRYLVRPDLDPLTVALLGG
jgi:hypothetical protein